MGGLMASHHGLASLVPIIVPERHRLSAIPWHRSVDESARQPIAKSPHPDILERYLHALVVYLKTNCSVV